MDIFLLINLVIQPCQIVNQLPFQCGQDITGTMMLNSMIKITSFSPHLFPCGMHLFSLLLLFCCEYALGIVSWLLDISHLDVGHLLEATLLFLLFCHHSLCDAGGGSLRVCNSFSGSCCVPWEPSKTSGCCCWCCLPSSSRGSSCNFRCTSCHLYAFSRLHASCHLRCF